MIWLLPIACGIVGYALWPLFAADTPEKQRRRAYEAHLADLERAHKRATQTWKRHPIRPRV